MATVTRFTGTMPHHGQSESDFNASIDNLFAYLVNFGPEINQAISEVLVGANVTLYNSGTTYTPPRIIAGSNGLRYSLTAGAPVTGDNPVTSVTGRWVKVSLDESTIDTAPPCAVFMHFGDTPLDGTLELDGSAVSRSAYSRVFAKYGTMYGEGDGSTTFNLPDPRGMFPRVWDHGAGIDPNAATRTNRGDGTGGDVIGSKQDSQNKAHTHTVANNIVLGGSYYDMGNNAYETAITNATSTTSSNGGTEARPVNINVMLCVKY